MPEINIDIEYFDHRKTKRLVLRFGEDAAIYPIKIWSYAARHHPIDGLFAGYADEEISAILSASSNATSILQAMLDVGFLERTPKGIAVHGWVERQGHIVAYHERAKHAAVARWSKLRNLKVKDATSIDKDATSNALQEEELVKQAQQVGKGVQGEKPEDVFERIRKSYPGTKKGFSWEWSNFERKNRKRIQEVLPLIEAGVERYKAEIASQGTEKRFIKHFSTWINQECWTEEPAQGGSNGTTKPNPKSTLSDRLGAQARRLQEQVRRIDGQSQGVDYQDVDVIEPGNPRRPSLDRGDVQGSYPPMVQNPFGDVG